MLPEIRQGLTALERVDEYSMPTLRGGKYFFEKRLADENQASIYVRDGWTGEDQRLIDATKLSADQNTSVHIEDISEDGSLLVYGVQQGGADENRDAFSAREGPQGVARHVAIGALLRSQPGPGNKGIYYSRFTHEGTTVWFHRFGTPVSADARYSAANIAARSWARWRWSGA